MGQINAIAKWDLENDRWRKIETKEDKKRALSIVDFGDVIYDESDQGKHYILIADGYRVENLSKDTETVNDRKDGIRNVINFFDRKKDNYHIELLLVDNDAPLREDGKFFATYIDHLAANNKVKSINYLGFSKCGVIGFDMIKYIKTAKGLAKTNVYCISSPFTGTLVASPKILEREARMIIEAKLGKNAFSEKVSNALIRFYKKALSNSHMDFDIALPGGVGDEYRNSYDPSFLENIFSSENIQASIRPNHFQNICTVITEQTTKDILRKCDLVGLGLLIMNEVFFDEPSDGLVALSAQCSIEPHIQTRDNPNNLIIPSPHSVLTHPYRDDLLNVVETTIEKKPYIKRP